MIIFGTRGVTSTKETGPFNCPFCGDQRAYSRKSVRRFFTLYFIPIIPLDEVGQYIECLTCKQQYNEEVLAYDPIAEVQQLQRDVGASLKRILAIMMMADGKIDDAQIATACQGYEQVLGVAIDRPGNDLGLVASVRVPGGRLGSGDHGHLRTSKGMRCRRRARLPGR